MLVLSRKVGEKLVFPGLGITIEILEPKGRGNTRLGIEAPKDVKILREELLPEDSAPVAETEAPRAPVNGV